MGTSSEVIEFKWAEDLATGIGIVDDQHRQLIARINMLFEAVDEGDLQTVGDTVSYLTEYVIHHFSAEESIMMKHLYPHFEEHRDQHSLFIKKVFNLRKQIVDEGVTEELTKLLEQYLIDWLITHIKVQDKKIAAIINA